MNSYISLKSWTIRLGRAAAAIVASRDFDWAALQAVGGIMISTCGLCAYFTVRAEFLLQITEQLVVLYVYTSLLYVRLGE